MTYLSLDIGTRRIGVAVGSAELQLATPLRVIERRKVESDAARILALAREYDAERIVVGLPRELDGSIGAQARTVMAYAESLAPRLGLTLEFFDERYSTAEALSRRRQAGISDKRGRATIDAAAAAVILQDFFDAMTSTLGPSSPPLRFEDLRPTEPGSEESGGD
jgi:putative pre-16S rRNA nuclease